MCYILIAQMAGCAAPEVADLRAYGRRVMLVRRDGGWRIASYHNSPAS